MDLVFVDRQSYRRRQDPDWLARFDAPDTLIVPEGGSSPLAIPGVAELVGEVPFSPDLWVLALRQRRHPRGPDRRQAG